MAFFFAAPEVIPIEWASNRPELSVCTPKQLLEDIRKFLEARRGKQLQANFFPDVILNGAQLDLNAMYRAVCSRGGYGMGTGVNWAGQVRVTCASPDTHLEQCMTARYAMHLTLRHAGAMPYRSELVRCLSTINLMERMLTGVQLCFMLCIGQSACKRALVQSAG